MRCIVFVTVIVLSVAQQHAGFRILAPGRVRSRGSVPAAHVCFRALARALPLPSCSRLTWDRSYIAECDDDLSNEGEKGAKLARYALGKGGGKSCGGGLQ
jgi:hypothetical protein